MTDAIRWMEETAARHADRPFLIEAEGGRTLTFAGMREAGLRVAAELARAGLRRGDRAAFVLSNSADFAALYFGCLYAGVVTVPVNPLFGKEEIGWILRHSGARLVVVSPETAALVDDPPGGEEVRTLGEDLRPSDLPPADDLLPFEGVTPRDTMTIVYTSGTTARPTGVVHRIADLVDNARLFNARVGIGPDHRFYGILAMAYLGGYYNLLFLPFVAGASVVLAPAFDARRALDFWTPAREHGVNTLWLVPTILAVLLEADRGSDGERLCRESIRTALVGTAPLPVPLRRRFEARYGTPLLENYGLTETLFLATEAPDLPHVEGSVGRPLPGVELTILDDTGRAVPYGTEGEIAARTPHLMEGTYDPQLRGPVPAPDGWFRTGDVGILAPTGEISITGRKKDLIIRAGLNISPAAIEAVLAGHPAVAECAVVGIPHPVAGEEIAAAVRLRDGSDIGTVRKDLDRTCTERLPPPRRPSHIVALDTLPRSSSGKIRKADLRGILARSLGRSGTDAPPPTEGPPVLPGRIRHTIRRPDPARVRELASFPTGIISDCLNRMGGMTVPIRSQVPGRPFCGPAVTVEEVEGGNLMSHAALEILRPGDVLAIDAKGILSRACWGGIQSRMAAARGAAAVVVHGVVRDLDTIRELALPVYALGVSPAGPFKGWTGNVNEPIACGGAVIRPGDLVRGDDDGVVVVPADRIEEILPLCRRRRELETEWERCVDEGRSTVDAVGLRDRLGPDRVEHLP